MTITARILINGCDDGTSLILELTESEFETVRTLGSELNAYAYSQCQPGMTLFRDGEIVLQDPVHR